MHTIARYLRHVFVSLRMLLIFTAILGLAYPLTVLAIAHIPGLAHRADGSLVSPGGKVAGSSLIGQNFTDPAGNPLRQYFQPRPSAAGAAGYDPTASGASNLGPESIVDTLAVPGNSAHAAQPARLSLLTQVCARSLAIGQFNDVDGSRPFCTSGGVGAVLAVFWSGPGYHGTVTRVISINQGCPATPFIPSYDGVPVQCATPGADYAKGQIVPVRGNAPASPAVPADAVTASGSGLDPDISPAYAELQAARVAAARDMTVAQVQAVVRKHTTGRALGFLGEPAVNVLDLNLDLDRNYPVPG